jgi:nucleoside kinase
VGVVASRERIAPTGERPWQLLVTGHTNIDRYLWVDELPRADRTVPIRVRSEALGGTAANIARVAARSGIRTSLMSRVGPDFPASFRGLLEQEKVDLASFVTVAGSSSPTCFIVEDGRGSQMTFIDQGPMADERRVRVPKGLIARSEWVHLTTGDPSFQLRVAEAAHRSGTKVAADPAQEIHYRWNRRDLTHLLDRSEVFFGNRSEAERAAQALRVPSVRRMVDRIPLVVVTLGRQGAMAITRRGIERVPSLSTPRAIRVTGAGDAFRGGFYSGWLLGRPLRVCLQLGARTAARWIRSAPEHGGTTRGPNPRRPAPRPTDPLGS